MDWTDRIGRRIKLRDLHIFMTVVRAGSMGKAARELAVSQPVVSKSIAELEHALGHPLLDRYADGVVPTLYGRVVLDCSRVTFDDLRQGVKALEHLSDPSGGELWVGSTEAGAMGFVPEVIDRLCRQYPRVAFRVVTGDAATLIERELRSRNVELVLGATSAPIADLDVHQEILFEDRHVVMSGAKSKWARRRGITLGDLISEPWILPSLDSSSGRAILEAFKAAGFEPPRVQVVAFSIPLCHYLLATGRYVAALPATLARLRQGPTLRLLDVKFGGVSRSIAVSTLRNRTLSPLATLFIGRARETAAEWSTKLQTSLRGTRARRAR